MLRNIFGLCGGFEGLQQWKSKSWEAEEGVRAMSRDSSWMFCPISGNLMRITAQGAICELSGYKKDLKGMCICFQSHWK